MLKKTIKLPFFTTYAVIRYTTIFSCIIVLSPALIYLFFYKILKNFEKDCENIDTKIINKLNFNKK